MLPNFFLAFLLFMPSSGLFYDGTLTSATFYYAEFSQTSYLYFPNPFTYSPLAEYTIAFWIKLTDCTNGAVSKKLLGCSGITNLTKTGRNISWAIPGTTIVHSDTATGLSAPQVAMSQESCAQWIHLALIYKGSKMLLWFNFELASSATLSTTVLNPVSDAVFIIGLDQSTATTTENFYLRHFLLSSKSYSSYVQIKSLGSAKPSYSSSLLFYHTFTRQDFSQSEYLSKNLAPLTYDTNLQIDRCNEPENVCTCTSVPFVVFPFKGSNTHLENSASAPRHSKITIQMWFYIDSLPQSVNSVLIFHKYALSIEIPYASQMLAVTFYSPSEGLYRKYGINAIVPMHTWMFLSLTFNYNTASVVLFPPFSKADLAVDIYKPNEFPEGSLTDLSIGTNFYGDILYAKYYNKLIEITSESDISYPTEESITSDSEDTTNLLYYYILTSSKYNSLIGQYGIFINQGIQSDDYLLLTSASEFHDSAPVCDIRISNPNECFSCYNDSLITPSETDNADLTFKSGNSGLASWITDFASDLTLEIWLYNSNPSQPAATVFSIEDANGKIHFKAAMEPTNNIVCYPNIKNLGTSVFASFIGDGSSWEHITCSVNASNSKTTLIHYTIAGDARETSISHSQFLISASAGLFYAFIGKSFQGALKELRLWKGGMAGWKAKKYLHQSLDTGDSETLYSTLWLYFPFKTITERTTFTSTSNAVTAKVVKMEDITDNAISWEKASATSSQSLVICRPGTIYINSLCAFPNYSMTAVELATDYNVSFTSENIPLSDSLLSYKWLEPLFDAGSSTLLTSYVKAQVDVSAVSPSFSFLLYKPAFPASSLRTITFRMQVTPNIYSQILPAKIIAVSFNFTNNLNCPSLSLLPSTEITFSNLNFSAITITPQYSACSASFTSQQITFSILPQSTPILNYFTRINTSSINITEDNALVYVAGKNYTLQVSTNVSFAAPSSDFLFNQTLSLNATILRFSYSLVFLAEGNTAVSIYDTMALKAEYGVLVNGVFTTDITGLKTEAICPAGGFPASLCASIVDGISLSPYDRVKYKVLPDTYNILFKGTWASLSSQQNLKVIFPESDPRIVARSGFNEIADSIVFQVLPEYLHSDSVCGMAKLTYNWWWFSNNTHASMLSTSYWLELEKNELYTDGNDRVLVVELNCNSMERTFYDFIVLAPRQTDDVDSIIKIDGSESYELTPFADPYVLTVRAIKTFTYVFTSSTYYILEVYNSASSNYTAMKAIVEQQETEIYLPYTTSLRLAQYTPYSVIRKSLAVKFVNIYSVPVDDYLQGYLQANESKLSEVFALILHVKSTGNKWSFTQKQNILVYLWNVLNWQNNSTAKQNIVRQQLFLNFAVSALSALDITSSISLLPCFMKALLYLMSSFKENVFLIVDFQSLCKDILNLLSSLLIKGSETLFTSSEKYQILQDLLEILETIKQCLLPTLMPSEELHIEATAISLHALVFTNLQSEIANSPVFNVSDATHNYSFSINKTFSINGGISQYSNGSTINRRLLLSEVIIDSNTSYLVNYGIVTTAIASKYLEAFLVKNTPDIGDTQLNSEYLVSSASKGNSSLKVIPIQSNVLLNFSLYYTSSLNLSGFVWLAYPRNQKIANQYFVPKVTFNKDLLTIPSDALAAIAANSTSCYTYCYCSSILVNSTAKCRTRAIINSSSVMCEFDSSTLIFLTAEYSLPVITFPANKLFILISYYVAIFTIALLLIMVGQCLDRENKKQTMCLGSAVSLGDLQKRILKSYVLSFMKSFKNSTFALVFCLFHPILGTFYFYNPIQPRFLRLSYMIYAFHIISSLLLIYISEQYSQGISVNYSSSTQTLLSYGSAFIIALVASIIAFPIYMVMSLVYTHFMEKSYEMDYEIVKMNERNMRNYADAKNKEVVLGVAGQSLIQENMTNRPILAEEPKIEAMKESCEIANDISTPVETFGPKNSNEPDQANIGPTEERECVGNNFLRDDPANIENTEERELPLMPASGVMADQQGVSKEEVKLDIDVRKDGLMDGEMTIGRSQIQHVANKDESSQTSIEQCNNPAPVFITRLVQDLETKSDSDYYLSEECFQSKYQVRYMELYSKMVCITEYNEAELEEVEAELMKRRGFNAEAPPPCLIPPKPLPYPPTCFRNFFSPTIACLSLIVFLYYTSLGIWTQENELIFKWFFVTLLASLFISLVWSTLYICVLAFICKAYIGNSSGCAHECFGRLLPQEMKDLLLVYSLEHAGRI